MNKKKVPANKTRTFRLNSLIDDLFAELGPDEIDILSVNYEQCKTLMFKIVQVSPRDSFITDLFKDTEFRPVIFPDKLIPHLRGRDVFLGPSVQGFGLDSSLPEPLLLLMFSRRYSVTWVV